MPGGSVSTGACAHACIATEAALEPLTGRVQDAKRDMRSALSRAALLGELRVKKVIDLVPEPVRRIHSLLEADFNPLQLCKWVLARQRSLFLDSSESHLHLLTGQQLLSSAPCLHLRLSWYCVM